jgi:hypothetical protein
MSSPASIPYATPIHAPPKRTGAGFAILFGGIALVFLGGCFLIGVLIMVNSNGFNGQSSDLTGSQSVLLVVLYICAAASFIGAVTLLVIGTRALLQIVRG